MSSNWFLRGCDDSSHQGQAKRQLEDGDAGHASKVPLTESGIWERGVLPTASELEMVSTLRMKRGDREGGAGSGVVDGTALDKKGKTYLLAWDVVNGSPANVSWEQVDVLDFIGFKQ